MSDYNHTPVLLNEVVALINPQPGGTYLDATLGGGGYTAAILERSLATKVLALDLDQASIAHFKIQHGRLMQQATLVQENFANIASVAKRTGITQFNGIVADIGFSSVHIDNPERGFSFQANGPLDMRFNTSQQVTAAFLVNHNTQSELADIFYRYGEEKLSKQIAAAIVAARRVKPLATTFELSGIIAASVRFLPPPRKTDTIRRCFQALRIAVNHELDNLERFLPDAFDLLTVHGVLAVVSFHSLEDRIVKQYFNKLAKGCVCPPDFPICQCGLLPRGKLLTHKPITASAQELVLNPRSRPAKLRAIQKL